MESLINNPLVIDIETSIGEVPEGTKLFGADCAHSDADPLLIGVLDGDDTMYFDAAGFRRDVDLTDRLVVGHNFSFDWSHLGDTVFDTSFMLWDTMIAEYLLENQYTYDLYGKQKSLSLDSLINAKESEGSKHVQQMFKHGYGIDYIAPEMAQEYLKADLHGTKLLFQSQLQRLRNCHPTTFTIAVRYMVTQMTAALTTADMHRRGLYVDRRRLEQLREIYKLEITNIKSYLNTQLRRRIDPGSGPVKFLGDEWMNSPAKLKVLLYGGEYKYLERVPTGTRYKSGAKAGQEKTKLEQRVGTYTGVLPKSVVQDYAKDGSTDATTLGKMSEDYRIPETAEQLLKPLLKMRELNKSVSTYVDGLEKHIYPDGRIHGNYSHARTATKRLSSSRPNLQNLSNVEDEMSDGTVVEPKSVFRAPLDYRYVEIDYSSLEVRVLALASNDSNLIKHLNDGVDMHRMFAARLFDKAGYDVSDAERKMAKAFSFQLQYGASAHGISKQWDQPLELVQRFIDQYYEEFPKVKQYHEFLLQHLAETGQYLGHQSNNTPVRYATLPSVWAYNGQRDLSKTHAHVGGFGMVEQLPLNDRYNNGPSFKPTTAKNYPIQGAAADIMNSTLVALRREMAGTDCTPVNTVHDSVLFLAKDNVNNGDITKAKEVMEDVPARIKAEFNLTSPVEFPCDVEVGSVWTKSEMKSLTL